MIREVFHMFKQSVTDIWFPIRLATKPKILSVILEHFKE